MKIIMNTNLCAQAIGICLHAFNVSSDITVNHIFLILLFYFDIIIIIISKNN